MKWYHYGYVEACMIHDYCYALEEYPKVKWYHYIMAIAVLCAWLWANMEVVG